MSENFCPTHGIQKVCYGGRNAHSSNWYCPLCEKEGEAKVTGKRIVYCVTGSGMDGMGETKVLYASFSEFERDKMLAADKSKAHRSVSEFIINTNAIHRTALSKLDGVDRLVLGLPTWPDNVKED